MDEAQQGEQVIFEAALRLPAESRGEFLCKACSNNEELHQRLAARLRLHDQAQDGSEASTVTAPDMLPGPRSFRGEEPGDQVGPYTLLEELGEGGMGVVWKANQIQPLRRQVALKVIKASFDSNRVLARFAAERQALALMDHPNIAKVFDAGATPTGRPYFVMELVLGTSITDFCNAERLSMRGKLELFLSVCQGVQHAHQKGIVHRDLKPSNVLVTTYDGKPVPKIIDFGVAKATERPVDGHTAFTEYGVIVGTLEYMSPEQAGSDQRDVDTRSDIYGLGALLYELITGTTPFPRRELRRETPHEALRRIREEEPPKPSLRLLQATQGTSISAERKFELQRLVSVARGDLDWIVMKCLEKDRARRYETANGLGMDIRRYLENEPVLARPPSKLYRVQKLVRRNRLAFSLLSLVILALVTGGSFSIYQALKARSAEHKSTQVAKFLQEMLQGVGPSVARGRDTTLLQEILTTTEKRVEKELQSEPDVALEIKDTIGAVYLELGNYTNSESIFRESLATRRRLYGNNHPDTATALNNLAICLATQNKLVEAESLHREALAIRRRLFGRQHPDIAASLNNLGNLLSAEGRVPEAEDLLRQGLSMREALFGQEHVDIAESLNDLSMVLKDEGKLAEAEQMQRRALAMTRRLRAEDHPNVANSLNNLAAILSSRGKFSEAEDLQREELALSTKILGEEHPSIAVSLNNLALGLRDQHKLSDAETVARQALELRKKILQPDNPDLAVSMSTLALVLLEERKLEEAESLDIDALALRQKVLQETSPDVADSLEDLAVVLSAEGKLPAAEKWIRESLKIREKTDPSDWHAFAAKSTLGGILLQENQWPEAERLLLEGYNGMKQQSAKLSADERRRLVTAARRLVELYSTADKPEQVAIWKSEVGFLQTNSLGNQFQK